MAILSAFVTLLVNIALILIAALIAYDNVPQILNGTATYWTYVWTMFALMLAVSASLPSSLYERK